MFGLKYLLFASATASALMLTSSAAIAQDLTVQEVAAKIDISGRQRMLSQRLAKFACLISIGIESDESYDQFVRSYELFVASHNALIDGNDAMGLPQETNENVLAALSEVEQAWAAYKPMLIEVIQVYELELPRLQTLDTIGLEVLSLQNAAVGIAATAYGEALPDVSYGDTHTEDIAGRQRMLSQKMVKEACLASFAGGSAVMSASLTETMALFDRSLTALQEGDAGQQIIAPPNAEVTAKLAEVSQQWGPMQEVLGVVADGGTLSVEALQDLAHKSDRLLGTMDEAVHMY